MDLTGLFNAMMQVVFIITGLVSIKSLTDMITQLVGQGDALKDGAETGKEVVKRAGQTAAIGAAGAGLAVKGARLAGRVGKNVGSTLYKSAAGTRLRESVKGVGDAVGGWAGRTRPVQWMGRQTNRIGNAAHNAAGWAKNTRVGQAVGAGYTRAKNGAIVEAQMMSGIVKGHLDPGEGEAIRYRAVAGARNIFRNLKNDETIFKKTDDTNKGGTPKGMWHQFAETGQDFNKLVGGVSGFTGFYKQMEGDDAVPGGDEGPIHKFMGSVFKFKNDKEKGKDQTIREADAYAAANAANAGAYAGANAALANAYAKEGIKELIKELGHEYAMRDLNGNVIRNADGTAQTITGLATMNVNADNMITNSNGDMISTGPQKVDISSMPEVRLNSDTKIKLDETKLTELYRNTGFIANTETSILKRLDDIAKALDKGGGSGSGGGNNS